jgi:ABC-type Fe3+-siderophore transport system permease subunit
VGMDIRWPIGLMFILLGAVLTGYGLVGDHEIYAKSLGINVNLIWGVVLLVFGLIMATFGKRAPADQSKSQQ